MLFTDKFKPASIQDIKGNLSEVMQLKSYVENKYSVVLYGPVGTGKTAAVYALANDLNYEVLEINASESLHKSAIESIVRSASLQQSLLFTGKIILIDGIDGISGRSDYGGIPAMIKLLKDTVFPVVFICNDPWDSKFSSLRRGCKMIEFKKIEQEIIFNLLKNICDKEGIEYKESQLRNVADSSDGDMRAGLNDLQVMIQEGKIGDYTVERRKRKETILNVLQSLFQGKGSKENIFEDLDMNLNEIHLWIEENLPLVYKDSELAMAFEFLAMSDVFAGRIFRNQYFRFLVYQNSLLRFGIHQDQNLGDCSYKRNERILKMWIGKKRYAEKRELIEKLGGKMRCSIRKASLELPYFYPSLKDDNVLRSVLA